MCFSWQNWSREEVIDRIKKGESLEGEDLYGLDLHYADLSKANLYKTILRVSDLCFANLNQADLYEADLFGADLIQTNLSGADLRRADLGKANLSRANLSRADLREADLGKADFSGANLSGTNLIGSNLNSANFEDADLSGADLTGTNIWNIATANWKIDGVKCEYIYNCKNFRSKKEKEKTRRNFAPGEFEQIYKSFPRLELIFKKGFSHLDHQALLAVVNHTKQELSDLEIRKFERVGDTTTVTLTAKTNETLEKIADEKLPKIYAEMLRGFTEIKNHLVHQNPQLPASIPEQWLAQVREIFEQSVHPPDEVVCKNQSTNFKEKFKKWASEKKWKIPEETFYRFLAELGIIFFRGFLPPH